MSPEALLQRFLCADGREDQFAAWRALTAAPPVARALERLRSRLEQEKGVLLETGHLSVRLFNHALTAPAFRRWTPAVSSALHWFAFLARSWEASLAREPLEGPPLPGAGPHQRHHALALRLRRVVEEMAAALSPLDLVLARLRRRGHTYERAAALLGGFLGRHVSVAAAKTRISRWYDQLAGRVAEELGEEYAQQAARLGRLLVEGALPDSATMEDGGDTA